MCGIAGFTTPEPGAGAVLAAMNAALAHRGPDASNIFIDGSIALGHTRLAIIDLTGGNQPRVDEESGDALVFNGEIYGYQTLAEELQISGTTLRDRSDTEVLFQLIRRRGLRRALARADGMFAFAFREGASGALFLVRDRFGEKPLYYGLARGQLVFASEVPAILCHPAFRHTIPDRLSAFQFLLFEYLPGDASGWTGIAKLEPGTILTFDKSGIRRERFWCPPIGTGRGRVIGETEAIRDLDQRLLTSIRRRVVADVPVGVFLSGGVDSSLVTALAARVSPGITAFSVRVGAQSFDETSHAIAVARHLGVRHEIVELGGSDLVEAFDAVSGALGEPLGDSSLLPTYLVCRAARQVMTVALGGDGADELFAGYPNFALQRIAPVMRRIPPAMGRLLSRAVEALPNSGAYMNRGFLLRQLSQGFGAGPARQSFLWMAPFAPDRLFRLWRPAALPEEALTSAYAPIDRYAAEAARLTIIDQLIYLFLTTYLPEDILTKTDRASMFNGLEVRAPFLDHNFAEYTFTLPVQFKLQGGTAKYILKRLAENYLPRAIVHRKKHGFAVPIGSLIRTLFWERCQDVLLSRRNPVADWFERAAIEALLAEHGTGRRDHGKKLWALYILFKVAERRFTSPPARRPLAQMAH